MPPIDIDHLNALHAASTPGERETESAAVGEWIKDSFNAWPAIYQEFTQLREELAMAKARIAEAENTGLLSIIRRLDPENLCDVIDDFGIEGELRAWLALREARMRPEGAAEWLNKEAIRARNFGAKVTADLLESTAARLSEEK